MTAGTFCTRVVATAGPGESVAAAARRMAAHRVGTLVVVEGSPTPVPVGLLTDRDLVVRCLAAGWDPDATAVKAVMSSPPRTVDEHAPLEDAVERLGTMGVRRLIVTGRDRELVGLLSVDDVIELLAGHAAAMRRVLAQQRPAVGA